LNARGVETWLYEMDATAGARTWREISDRRRAAGRIITICSTSALLRDGVLKELEQQIDEDPDKLIPISVDETWKERGFRISRGDRDLRPYLLERNYTDFSPDKELGAMARLLEGLQIQDDS
jgi:hypothetical protein